MALGTGKLQIIILGDGAVGKTSILKMYAEGKYTPSHITTIGKFDFSLEILSSQIANLTNSSIYTSEMLNFPRKLAKVVLIGAMAVFGWRRRGIEGSGGGIYN